MAIDFGEANKLEDDWKKKGSPPCEHPSIDKEYQFGASSGDYRCLTCGTEFTPGDAKAWKAERRS